ncbi:hypothetical protein A3D71_04620 [Candidatus Kaiserbacteria bacterium RIFCSPHIGHO2_02_FULL_55_20]|uniref:DUF5667 domain-containing protein n=1 Tax=Candidatus Kaiserbacteria bacterium RIFCSPHIGHO2_02_FULL_55_20 TaxID=1798497 RepID=A0A1F6DV63_9BACT|nr:MAG: hypothetical protein A3D71_04620 [Candidatus Kaiserbacteria bacterium RIFCSPHIGHO2_02_FULL_55_20]
MKKLAILSILFISLAFVVPAPALAQTDTGPTPGSFWYGITTTFENVNLFFTFNSEKKAEKALGYAEKRLAQAKAAAESENSKAVGIALTNYEAKINLASESSKKIEDNERAEKLLTSIADNTSRHQEVLSGVLEKVPEEAREAISRAIEVSKRGQEEATQQIAELKGEIEQLRQEVADLRAREEDRKNEAEESTKQSSGAKPQTTRPAIAPVTEPINPPKPTPTPTKSVEVQEQAPKISTDSLESELLKFLNEQLSQQTKSDLDYYQRTISDLQSLNQMQAGISSSGKQNCLTSYNSKVKYAKDDAQRQKTANAEAQRGFASSPAISQNIDAQLARDLEDVENWYNSCLAQYQADSSVSGRLSQVSSQLNSLRQRVNSGGTVSTSEVSAVGNEIVSISRALGEAAGVSGSVSLPSVGSRPSSITCTNDITGFSCRDNFGSNAMRCTQSTPGFLNCTDSNFNSVSCQSNSTLGSLRCSW